MSENAPTNTFYVYFFYYVHFLLLFSNICCGHVKRLVIVTYRHVEKLCLCKLVAFNICCHASKSISLYRI